MAHIDKTLDLRKDVYFDARVVDASRDEKAGVWVVKSLQGHQAQAKYLVLTTGLLHRAYTPDFPGIQDYKGELYHSGAWNESYNAKGKKVALIGAGATAVQITQELGKQADQLTVFLRRPSYCLPMGQRPLSEREQKDMKLYLPALFKSGRNSAAGFPLARKEEKVSDVSEDELKEVFEHLWGAGGFSFQLGNFSDVVLDKSANKVAYEFWASKVRARLTDPEKRKIMTPQVPPYFFGTKRSPLEQDYYEVLNQPNVSIHNLNDVPLKSFAEKGLIMADDKLHEFDTVVLATGFDSYTGSMTQMGLKNKDGVELKDLWKDGVTTYLGLTVAGFRTLLFFPLFRLSERLLTTFSTIANMFMAYSPQAPTPLSNGPTIIEAQVETIVDMIKKLESEGVTSIEAQKAAEQEWKAALQTMVDYTLFPFTDSWWNGGNIPGKKAENLLYVAGIDNYEAQIRATMDGWKGFDVVSAKA